MAGEKAAKAREVEVEESVRQGWLQPRTWHGATLAVGQATHRQPPAPRCSGAPWSCAGSFCKTDKDPTHGLK